MKSDDKRASIEMKFDNARLQAAAVAHAYMGLGNFIQDVVRQVRSKGFVDGLTLSQCRERAVLSMKDAEGLGLSISDEAQILKGGLALACFYLDGMNTDRRFNRMRPSIAPRKRHQAG